MTRLILIRHGETEWNRLGRWQGQTDVPLNPGGRRQARDLADRFQHEPLDSVYSSDLRRARETAQVLAEATGAPLVEDPRLREIHLGTWEGLLFDEIRRRDGDRLDRFRAEPASERAPGGEGVLDVQRRSLAALDEIVRTHPHGSVALVSHGLTLAVIKIRLLGLPLESVWEVEPANAAPEEYHWEAP